MEDRELRLRVREAVQARGVSAVAADIPASRRTVWRFVAGRTGQLSMAIRQGMETVAGRFAGQVSHTGSRCGVG